MYIDLITLLIQQFFNMKVFIFMKTSKRENLNRLRIVDTDTVAIGDAIPFVVIVMASERRVGGSVGGRGPFF